MNAPEHEPDEGPPSFAPKDVSSYNSTCSRAPLENPVYFPDDRSTAATLWYDAVKNFSVNILNTMGGIRATGRGNLPRTGGMLLVSNHASFLDVFALGGTSPRPLNYVARSTLFLPVLGSMIRSVGGFPIKREGMGAEGLKETLRRLKNGGAVILFPEGTRSHDGSIGPLKPGIAGLAARVKAPVVPAGLAGTFESWPRGRIVPRPHAVRVHYGEPIPRQELDQDPDRVTDCIRERMLDCYRIARAGLASDLAGSNLDLEFW